MTTFHLRLKGKVLPPMAEEKIKKMLELGQLDSSGQVSQDGTNWIEIGQHPVFKSCTGSFHPPKKEEKNITPSGVGSPERPTGSVGYENRGSPIIINPQPPPSKRMKTAHIALIGVAFLFGLIVVWGVAAKISSGGGNGGIKPPPEINISISAIEAVLKLDKQLADSMQNDIANTKPKKDEDLDAIAGRIQGYVSSAKTQMQSSLSSCPSDFAEAYYRHVCAWDKYSSATASHPHIPGVGEILVEGLLRGLGGDITGGAFKKEDEFKAWANKVTTAYEDIKSTWVNVEAIAIRHGAKR